jgi:hypothetical protein
VATVTPDMSAAGPVLQDIFGEFGRISGLHLNLPKTYVVPLWRTDLAEVQRQLSAQQPGWESLQVTDHARYLGFELGPGRAHKAFEKPLAKYLDRAQWWGNTGCGLFLTTVAYTTYIASVLSFLVQLDDLPPSWDEKEREAFSRLVPGFSQWTSSDDLRRLRLLGFPRDFTDMRTRQFAAKVRVAHLEAAGSGGLDVRRRAAALKDLRQKSDEVVLCAAWRDWLDRSFLLQLDNAVREAAARGITRDSVERRILGEAAARPISPQQAGQIKRRFQAMVATMLQQNQPVCIESRIRHKLSRWRVAEFPRARVERALPPDLGPQSATESVGSRMASIVERMAHESSHAGAGRLAGLLICLL